MDAIKVGDYVEIRGTFEVVAVYANQVVVRDGDKLRSLPLDLVSPMDTMEELMGVLPPTEWFFDDETPETPAPDGSF